MFFDTRYIFTFELRCNWLSQMFFLFFPSSSHVTFQNWLLFSPHVFQQNWLLQLFGVWLILLWLLFTNHLWWSDDFKQWWLVSDDFSQHWWNMSDDLTQHWWWTSMRCRNSGKVSQKNITESFQQSYKAKQTLSLFQ